MSVMKTRKARPKRAIIKLSILLVALVMAVSTISFSRAYAAEGLTPSAKVMELLEKSSPVFNTNARPANNIKLQINGKPQTLRDPIIMENERVFLPARNLGELLGVEIDYLANEKLAIAHNSEGYLELPLGYTEAVKDKSLIVAIDPHNSSTRILNYLDRTYLPVRFISENLGFKITYANNTVSIRTEESNQVPKEEKDYKESLTYSNLLDPASQAEVRQAMKAAGILPENIDSFFEEVNDFNSTIEAKTLVEKGFTTIDSLEPEYDLVAMLDMWDAKNPQFIGYNCRMTSYDLMKDVINIGKADTTNANWLVFDKNALEYSPKEIFNQGELEEFLTLYSYVPTEETQDISFHVNKIQEDWKGKGIEFSNEDKRTVVSVFFHDEYGYLFIGHMGVLIPAEDGKLLFIEKLSFQAPYQAVKFDNRTDLNDYLMNKYDISWNQPTAKPFIMENDQLLEGYRENPKNLERD